ncbi:cytochrome C assembly family protein [Zooshikella sp. RANM57]|uniref:cytochrome C assembly family protein n=1 Tax=Zooshikella sp. RANM57 TaxID=3425863 RepID=UPI003D6E628B
MNIILPSLIAVLLYAAGSVYQGRALVQGHTIHKPLIQGIALTASILQMLSIYFVLHTQQGIDLSYVNVGSLISWLIINVVLLSSLRKPVENLFVILFPIAATTILLSAFHLSPTDIKTNLSAGMILHVLFSVLAYSILTIAFCQALLLAYQDYRLKHRHPTGMIRLFPPLQTMESLLFEFLWAGLLLLSCSLLSGFIALDNSFVQSHKASLSIIAWLVFAILLWGRHALGWRGITAIRWTICGFTLLVLAYFGSKLLLDLIKQAG